MNAAEPSGGIGLITPEGTRKVRYTEHLWRLTRSMKIDGIVVGSRFGGNRSDPENIPPLPQYRYFDNIPVSTEPITH